MAKFTVDRCLECPFHQNENMDQFWCHAANNGLRMGPWDRAFPRWCPLLKGPLTVATVKRNIKNS